MKRGISQSIVTAIKNVIAYTKSFLEKYFFTGILFYQDFFAPPIIPTEGANF